MTLPSALAIWNTDSDAKSPCLQADGTLVISQDNGQVCMLKLHHGHRRITLAEAEASEAAPQTQDGKTARLSSPNAQDARLETPPNNKPPGIIE